MKIFFKKETIKTIGSLTDNIRYFPRDDNGYLISMTSTPGNLDLSKEKSAGFMGKSV
jgi:translation elongation factor EF-4